MNALWSAAVVSGVAAADPLAAPEYVEKVTVEFASAADAQAAELKIMPLFGGAKLAFTSRWDDSSPAHAERMEMFRRLGWNATFFLNGGGEFVMSDAGKKIIALGGRFGNHTVSHPYLMESGINKIFAEVMENKIEIEAASDVPVTSFVIPFNWNCALEPSRAAKLGKILVDTGHFVSSDWPNQNVAQSASSWMPGNTFSSDDTHPSAEAFEKGIKGAVASVENTPDYPKVTWGIHSWCKEEGLALQENFVKKVLGNPEWWYTDDAHYGAYRYEFFHAKIRKAGVNGKTAVFEVTRHDPAYTGADQPLTFDFGDVKAVKVDVDDSAKPALPVKIDVAADGKSIQFPGLEFVISVDEAKGVLDYELKNLTGREVGVLGVVVNPAPMWSNGRIAVYAQEGRSVPKKNTVELGGKNRTADYQTGGRFYAAGVDFILDGERGRIYATAKIEGEKVLAADTPRDTVLVLGPFKAFNEDDLHEAEWIKWSVPDVVLPNCGTGVTEYWRSMADKARVGFSAAAYIPWDGKEPKEFKDAATEAFKSKGNKSVMLAAFDFECDADGEKDFLVYDGSWTPHVFYLNGEKTEGKGGKFRIKVKKGPNRMLLRWVWGSPWQPQALLLSVCDDGDVNKAVKFVKPKTNPRETVFESKGLSGEFTGVRHDQS